MARMTRRAKSKTLYLLDAPIYVFRAYFSLPETLRDSHGEAVNAVYGFATFLCGLLAREHPTHIVAAFDESLTSSFRNDFFPTYKANRELPPAELERQFDLCKRFARALGVRVYASRRFEADDIIATVSRRAREDGFRLMIVSRDKDLAQLLNARDRLWDGADGPRQGPADILARFGIPPRLIPDYLALVGDAVDNIPGVPGIGAKTAAALLQAFGTLDRLLAAIDRVPELEIRGAVRAAAQLAAYREQALLSRRLATLHDNVRVRCTPEDLAWKGIRAGALQRLLGELGFGGRLAARCQALHAA
jgi:DNA polymerase-1